MWFIFIPRIRIRARRTCRPARKSQPVIRPNMEARALLTAAAAIASIIAAFTAPDGWWSAALLFAGWFVLPIAGITFAYKARRPKPEPPEPSTEPVVRTFAKFILNTAAIFGLIIGSLAALTAVFLFFHAIKGESAWKYFFILAAIAAATLPPGVWLFNRTYDHDKPEPPEDLPPHLIEPSPKLPPDDDGPLNPRMFYSDRR